MPHAFGFYDWFEARFGDLCAAHDAAYKNQTGKLAADWAIVSGIWKRGYRLLSIGAFITLGAIGWFHYYKIETP